LEVRKRSLPLHSQLKGRGNKKDQVADATAINKQRLKLVKTQDGRQRPSETKTRRYIKGDREVLAD